VLGHHFEEVARRQPLALQAPLHVGERQQNGVDRTAFDVGSELLEGHRH